MAACAVALYGQTPQVNAGAALLEDFSKRVAAYAAIHKKARAEVHPLKPTANPEAIEKYEHHLAHRIRELRKNFVQGAIFTPEIGAEFGRLIKQAMQGATGPRLQASLKHAEPVRLPALHVGSSYPEHVPLQSTPPSVLANLPKLPPEVEYRVVGNALVLRDVDANLIVDFIRNVIP
jgi:hypothetical protein